MLFAVLRNLVEWWVGAPEVMVKFSKQPDQRSKVIQRSSCLRNALRSSNLKGRTLDRSVLHSWVLGHAGVIRGQPGVKLVRNALWQPNLIERTRDRYVVHWWGQRFRGQPGSIRGQIVMPKGHHWWEELLTGQRGQLGVKLLRKVLRGSNMIGRTTNQCKFYCWGQRSCRD